MLATNITVCFLVMMLQNGVGGLLDVYAVMHVKHNQRRSIVEILGRDGTVGSVDTCNPFLRTRGTA